MDNIKCGKFIAGLRRAKGLTQGQLAECIGVTDKAVSKWETGRGFPDVSVLSALAETLGVTITELVNGERSQDVISREDVDRAVTSALESAGKTARGYISAVLVVIGAVLVLLPLYLVGVSGAYFIVFGAALIAVGIFLRTERLYKAAKRLYMRLPANTAVIFSVITAAAALMCELLPFSAAMRFAAGPNDSYTEYTSYFALLQIGYGNLLPIITAGCTAAVIVLSVIRLFMREKRRLSRAAVICAAAGALCSAAIPVLFGASTAFNVIIALLLAVSAFLSGR